MLTSKCVGTMLKRWIIPVIWLFSSAFLARADVTLLLEEPYGAFGGMTPTGHAAIYLSRVCAETPLSLRRCEPGEQGVVLSRYHRVGGFDWIAIPLIPYLYAVETAAQVPVSVTPEEAASLRDTYRKKHLEAVAHDNDDGSTPKGDWTQLVGEAYDRSIYTFGVETTEAQDDAFIRALNSSRNRNRFHILSKNCADFARQMIDFYYPKSVHRNFMADLGIMTPKQAAKSLVSYGKKHPNLELSSFKIAQVPGSVPRSSPVRGVLESFVKSKRYAAGLVSLAVLHPAVGVGMAYALVEGSRFNPRRFASTDGTLPPEGLVGELGSSGLAPPAAGLPSD
jgi:hypothetical protein